jgi:hypothetical protein
MLKKRHQLAPINKKMNFITNKEQTNVLGAPSTYAK